MKNVYSAVFALLIVAVLSGCLASAKRDAVNYYTVENNFIPPDFGKDSTILICVIHSQTRTDNKTMELVNELYHGKVEFVLKDSVRLNKYYDFSKYRFILDSDTINGSYNTHVTTSSGGSNAIGGSATYYYFYIRDLNPKSNDFLKNSLLVEKKFENPNSRRVTTNFRVPIYGFMINLEKQRLLNKK